MRAVWTSTSLQVTHLPSVCQVLQSDDAFAFALVVAEQIILRLHDRGPRGRDGGVGQFPAQFIVHRVVPVLLLHLPGWAFSLRGDGNLRYLARIHHRQRSGVGRQGGDLSGILKELIANLVRLSGRSSL